MLDKWKQKARELRRIRVSLGLRAREVAEGAGLDRTTISKYEGLKAKPSDAALVAWEQSLRALVQELQRRASATVEAA